MRAIRLCLFRHSQLYCRLHRIRSERDVVQKLGQPNLERLHGVAKEMSYQETGPWLWQKLLKGPDALTTTHKRPLTEKAAPPLCRQLATAPRRSRAIAVTSRLAFVSHTGE